jgi:hypothetical protein
MRLLDLEGQPDQGALVALGRPELDGDRQTFPRMFKRQ